MLISSKQILYAPPEHNEIEISLFGPGIGECIVVHIGNDEWIIVDSCIDSFSKEPVPLNYLDKLGVSPNKSVKLFVITHWHSDHIRGASKIAQRCDEATICFSEALLREEFLTLVSIYSGLEEPVILDRENCGTREISSIIKTIRNRCEKQSKRASFQCILASADKRIFQSIQEGVKKEIWALSPSSKTIADSLLEIAGLIPLPSKSIIRRVIPIPTKNNNAIVLWINYGGVINILLGADLEETTDHLSGWAAIVNSPNRPQGKARIFKIPHHGSKTAHSSAVWANMIENESVCLLTTKIGGQSNIPKESDIIRLKRFSPHLYCTLEPLSKKQKRDSVTEKTMKGIIKKRMPLNGDIGHIQIRFQIDGELKVGLKQPAKEL